MASADRQRAIKTTGILRIVFGSVCLVILLAALAVYLFTTVFSAATARTQGTVTALVSNDKGGLAPEVSYTVAGKTYIQHSELFSSFNSFKVGDLVTILYEPGNPQNSEIEGQRVGSFVALLLGIIGLVWAFVTVIMVVINFRLRHRRN